MLVRGRLYRGEVNHIWDHKWPGQSWYQSVCGQFKTWEQIVSDENARLCKSCKRSVKYENTRARPITIDLSALMNWEAYAALPDHLKEALDG